MKRSKIVCFLLAAVMILTFAGVNVFAADKVTSITITGLEEPEIGAVPDYTWITAEKGITLDWPGLGARWYESADGVNYTLLPEPVESGALEIFKEGYFYKFEVSFALDAGYEWYITGGVTINGKDASRRKVDDSVVVEKDFGKLLPDTLKHVSIMELEPPAPEQTPDYNWVAGEEPAITCTGGVWYESADGKTYSVMEKSNKFKEDYYYRFYVEYQTAAGYSWGDMNEMTVTIGYEPVTDFNIIADRIFITNDFGQPQKSLIFSITISGVTEPETGKKPVTSYTIDSSSNCVPTYEPGEGTWFESTDGGINFQPMAGDGVFKDGCVYAFMTEVSPKNGYAFDQIPVPYGFVNGRPAGVKLGINKEGKQYAIVQCVFEKLGGGLTVSVAGTGTGFYTYYPNKPIDAEVEVTGGTSQVVVEWFTCDALGNRDENPQPFATGLKALIPGIAQKDMMIDFYVMVIATDPGNGNETAAIVIPYSLFPAGWEDPSENGNLKIKTSDESGVFCTYDANTPIDAAVEVEGASSALTVEWFNCDELGNVPDNEFAFATGLSVKLPPIAPDNMMIPYYVKVVATDGDKMVYIVVPCMLYPKGVEYPDDLVINTKDNVPSFDTYKADTPVDAEVTVTGGSDSVVVEWFFCDANGATDSKAQPFATGLKVQIPGIAKEKLEVAFYVKIVATDPANGNNSASLVVPYRLLPSGDIDPETETPTPGGDPTATPEGEPAATEKPEDGSTAKPEENPTEKPETGNDSNGMKVAIIVLSIVGGIAVLACIVLAAFLIIKKRK